MGALDFSKCCFCIDLRAGCLVIGYLSLVGEILTLIGVGLMAMAGAAMTIASQDEESHIDAQSGVLLLVISAILLLFLVILLAFTIVLLVGVHQHKRGHVKAYLIYSIIFQVIFFIIFLTSFANKPIVAYDVIKNICIILLNLYFLLVIRSYYRKMDDNHHGRPAIYNSA